MPDSSTPGPQKIPLLLAEDEPEIARLLERMLWRKGYQVDIAINGREAVDMAAGQGYRMILMDLDMPVMDGFEATREIRKTDAQVPIIALTAANAQANMPRALALGVNGYIQKPVTLTQLLETMRQFMQRF